MSMRTILIALAAITTISLIGAAAGFGNVLPTQQEANPSVAQVETIGTPAPSGTRTGSQTPSDPRVTPGPGSAQTPADAATTLNSSDIVTDRQAFILLNPATVRPGSSVGVTGSGFDPGSQIDFTLKRKADEKGQGIGFVQADKGGSFGGFSFTLPDTFSSGNFILVAKQHDGKHETSAIGRLTANSPVVTFGTQVGKPGDDIAFSLKGFSPREEVKVYWNSLGAQPVATLQMDEGGGLLSGSIPVPFGAVGNNSFIFVGEKSQSPVTVPFLMLNLYPVASISAYAAKADTTLTFDGSGFGPKERVRVYLNSVQSVPVGIIEADDTGSFEGAGAFLIPFDLKGKNSFILLGEQSQAPATVSFDVLPYTPYAEASTYGGRPGTTITFYGQGFARNEVVHIFVGRGQGSPGEEVTCAKTDRLGSLVAGGSYTIPHNAEPGKLSFSLVGSKSRAEATAVMEVMDPGGTVPPPAASPQPFKCPFNDTGSDGADSAPAAEAPAAAPATAPTQQTPAQQASPARTPAAQQTATPQRTQTPATATPASNQQGRPSPSPSASPKPGATGTATAGATGTPRPSPQSSPTGAAPSPTTGR